MTHARSFVIFWIGALPLKSVGQRLGFVFGNSYFEKKVLVADLKFVKIQSVIVNYWNLLLIEALANPHPSPGGIREVSIRKKRRITACCSLNTYKSIPLPKSTQNLAKNYPEKTNTLGFCAIYSHKYCPIHLLRRRGFRVFRSDISKSNMTYLSPYRCVCLANFPINLW